MRLGDRFKELAEATRDSIVGREARSGTAVHGFHAVAPDPGDLATARRAVELGAPDPYGLITSDEVVALTGLPVGGPSLSYTDTDVAVRFEAEGGGRRWSLSVHAGHAVDETTPFDPGAWYTLMVQQLGDAEGVGLGDEALYRAGLLLVRGADRAFCVRVDAPADSPVRAWALRLGARVLARMASGVAG